MGAVQAGGYVAFGGMCLVLGAAAISDWRTGKVPNLLTYTAILAGLVLWLVVGYAADGWSGARAALSDSVIAGFVAFIGFSVIFAFGGLGGGDVKLMAVVGTMSANLNCVLMASIYAFAIGALMAVGTMVRKGLVGRTLKRIYHTLLLYGARVKSEMPTDSPRIAFAAAIFIGATLAGAERFLGVTFPWTPAGQWNRAAPQSRHIPMTIHGLVVDGGNGWRAERMRSNGSSIAEWERVD